MADTVQRLLVMYGGTRRRERARRQAVFERLAHPYTRGLFAARPRWALPRGTRLATIPGRVPELADMPAGCPFADRCALVDRRLPRGAAAGRRRSAPVHSAALHPLAELPT